MASAPLHRSAAFLRGLLARPRATGVVAATLRQVSTPQSLWRAVRQLSQGAARQPYLPNSRFVTAHSRPRPSTLHSAGRPRAGPQVIRRPAHEVGLGNARQFSSSARAVEDIVGHAPLVLRAVCDHLGVPNQCARAQSAGWAKAIVVDGRIKLDRTLRETMRRHWVAATPDTESLIQSEAVFTSLSQTSVSQESGLEVFIPVLAEELLAVESGIEPEDARVLSPLVMHQLGVYDQIRRGRFRRLQDLVSQVEEHDQFIGVQLVRLGPDPQAPFVYRVGIKSWTEKDLLRVMCNVQCWTRAVDWRIVHSTFEELQSLHSEEESVQEEEASIWASADLLMPSVEMPNYLSSSSSCSSSDGSGLGASSFLEELDGLRSPTFARQQQQRATA